MWILSLPLDGAEVLLNSDTGCVTQVRQVASAAVHLWAIVETLDDCRWASEVLHTTRWGHVQIVARNHVDLNLPLANDLLSVRDH